MVWRIVVSRQLSKIEFAKLEQLQMQYSSSSIGVVVLRGFILKKDDSIE